MTTADSGITTESPLASSHVQKICLADLDRASKANVIQAKEEAQPIVSQFGVLHA